MNHQPVPRPDDDQRALSALLAALRKAPAPATPPDFDALVRWLDGRASPDESAWIEARLRDDADLRRALVAARAGRHDDVPADELRRLEALVPGTPRARGDVVRFPHPRWRELAACAAAAALVAWPAWSLGRQLAQARDRAEQQELARLLGGNPLGGGDR